MEQFKIRTAGKAAQECVFVFGDVRVTAITDRLLRVEHSDSARFCDSPTQVVWNRAFAQPSFTVKREKNRLHASTGPVTFVMDLCGRILSMREAGGRRLSFKGNLRGTRRTLDMTFGPAPMGKGYIARGGAAVLDDSKSLLLDENSRVYPREAPESDKYYFAYGNDYRACLRDFYQLTGPAPLIPRWALGNWWSRYKAYTQEGYLALMDRFAQEGIPLTVAILDMDWHWVDLSRFGELGKAPQGHKRMWASGWTGHSWNTDLFPDYRALLRDLRERELKVTLNLHPADGLRAFEAPYAATAKAMGMDPAGTQPIAFDMTDPKFLRAYFEEIHHPYEEDGVGFWWIDWQQGRKSKLPGLDPLWALNHYHYYDNARKGEGLILSRYAGPGSHRYPLGFSGDTMINWAALRFQPWFTATAANAGYGWWSHDIGGHMFGKCDDELYLRWLQFGVFSPINRLHSTSNEFCGKEPWLRAGAVGRAAGELLRLRHRLIPYLYSMSVRAHREGIPLCEPLYYQYPDAPEAYAHRNVYFFGSELIAAPITEKIDPLTCRACVTLWLPPGRWTDIFTNQIYEGGRTYTVYRGLEQIPVFAKAGAVLPLSPAPCGNDCSPPETLCLDVWRGSNSFTLYEDDRETTFTVREDGDDLLLTISPGRARNYEITFRDIEAEPVRLENVNGAQVRLEQFKPLRNKDTREALIGLISSFQIGNTEKNWVYTRYIAHPDGSIPGRRRLRGPIREILELG